jgi:hypothetical protein
MSIVGIALRMMKAEDIRPQNVFVDSIGIGKGVVDRLAEQALGVQAVNVGEAPSEGDFINKRAEASWRCAEWIKHGGKLKRNIGFEELSRLKYKVQSDRKLKIISKDELLRDGIQSPDHADALMLTFIRPYTRQTQSYQPPFEPLSDYQGGVETHAPSPLRGVDISKW